MNVALVHWAIPPTTGGVESHVADLAVRLGDYGCGVTVITGERDADPLPGVDIRYLAALDLRSAGSSFDTPQAPLTELLRNIVREQGVDVVHGHNLHHFSAGPALALEDLRVTDHLRVHHTFHETWPDVLCDTPVYRSWDGNYAVSRFVQRACAQRIGFEPECMPLGVDVERFTPRQRAAVENAPPVILHPARALPWKGVHVSVEMLALLRDAGMQARLVITDTPRIIDWNDEVTAYRRRILSLIRTLGLDEVVELRAVRYRDMPDLYDEADLVIYPTVGEEPFGLVPLEAMSMMKPVIASRSGGLCETIVHGETGFLVDPGDATALATCALNLLRAPETRKAMGRAGRARVLEHFNGQRYVGALVERYRSSMQSRPG